MRRRRRVNPNPPVPRLCEQWLAGSIIQTPWGPIEPRINIAKLGSGCRRCGGDGRTVAAWYSPGAGAGAFLCEECWAELGTAHARLPWFWALWLYNLMNRGYIAQSDWPAMFHDYLAKWPLIEQAVRDEQTEPPQ